MSCQTIIGRDQALVGMVHVAALPATPQSRDDVTTIAERAVVDAVALAGAGYDAVIIENMHDVPYLRREVGPEIVAAMTAVGAAVRRAVTVALGVQILAGANRAALAVAHAIDAQFIRAEGFVFASVADEGVLDEADAGALLRYRRAIGAESVAILVDIKKKHSAHAITADVDIAETAKAAVFFGADGLIVSGPNTGAAANREELATVRAAVDVPLLVGSGITADSAAAYLEHANALIVGTAAKRDGDWRNEVDPARAKVIVDAVRG